MESMYGMIDVNDVMSSSMSSSLLSTKTIMLSSSIQTSSKPISYQMRLVSNNTDSLEYHTINQRVRVTCVSLYAHVHVCTYVYM